MKEFLREHIVRNWERDPRTMLDIQQVIYRFPNMYGASIVWGHELVNSDEEHPYELAVIQWANKTDFVIAYDTPIASDVIGYQNEEQIRDLLVRIKNLEEVVA